MYTARFAVAADENIGSITECMLILFCIVARRMDKIDQVNPAYCAVFIAAILFFNQFNKL